MPATIYEDDEVLVFWHPGQTDYALITFGDAFELASGSRFFADVPVQKGAISCIGIMARKPNWYPGASMKRVAEATAPYLANYRVRIGYGGSMGGYGAIKFSALLATSHTIALCPQWSIDRAECNGTNPGFQHWYRSDMTGHHIRPEDVSGQVTIFFDPLDQIDSFHAHRLHRTIADATLLHSLAVGHHVTKAFAGSSNLLELIAAAIESDSARLRMLASRFRRSSPERAHNVLMRGAERHPVLSARAAALPLATAPNRVGSAIAYQLPLLRALLRSGHDNIANAVLDIIQERSRRREDIAAVSVLMEVCAAQRKREQLRVLKTHHGTLIGYDVLRERLRQIPRHGAGSNDDLIPAYLHVSDSRRFAFCLDIQGARFWLRLTRDGRAEAITWDGSDRLRGTLIKMTDASNGLSSLRGPDGFLCASNRGAVSLDRQDVDDWERFQLQRVPDHYGNSSVLSHGTLTADRHAR